MALVTYSDSEASASDSESPQKPQPATRKSPPPANNPKRIVDRGNRRKILVNLDDTKGDGETGTGGAEDGEPSRKRARVGAAGSFGGFNSFLPEPKQAKKEPPRTGSNTKPGGVESTGGVFSLKTSSTPGFERNAGTETVEPGGYDEEQPAGQTQSKAEDVIPKGNAMMFKPLSVARSNTKKKKPPPANPKTSEDTKRTAKPVAPEEAPAPVSKPKVSLFGFSNEEKTVPSHHLPEQNATYQPLIYNSSSEPAPGPAPEEPRTSDTHSQNAIPPSKSDVGAGSQDLESIAGDLNLSQSEMRQLFGRRGQNGSKQSTGGPKILTFNTDEEYKSNAEYLSATSEAELAAQQHNPVRSIAPGKHSLQQLVNAVTNQRDALEESFASGKRSKKEASSKYGW